MFFFTFCLYYSSSYVSSTIIATTIAFKLLASSGFPVPSPGRQSTLWAVYPRYVLWYAITIFRPHWSSVLWAGYNVIRSLPLKFSNTLGYFGDCRSFEDLTYDSISQRISGHSKERSIALWVTLNLFIRSVVSGHVSVPSHHW